MHKYRVRASLYPGAARPCAYEVALGKHNKDVARQLRRWAERDDLGRIIVLHGDSVRPILEELLRRLSGGLD